MFKGHSPFNGEKYLINTKPDSKVSKDKVEKDLLIKCECEDGGCPNCSRVCKLLDELST